MYKSGPTANSDSVILWFTTGERDCNGYLTLVCNTIKEGYSLVLPTAKEAMAYLQNAREAHSDESAYPNAKPIYFERTSYRTKGTWGMRFHGRTPIEPYVDEYNADNHQVYRGYQQAKIATA